MIPESSWWFSIFFTLFQFLFVLVHINLIGDGGLLQKNLYLQNRFLVVQKISEGWFLRSFKISLHKLSAYLILFLVVVAGNQRP